MAVPPIRIHEAAVAMRDQFAGSQKGELDRSSFRPDAAAWAAMALHALHEDPDIIAACCRGLVAAQRSDGRVSQIAERPQTYWPTALALMAWCSVGGFEEAIQRGSEFLLGHTGQHWEKKPGSAFGHDPSIQGWPWIEETHSWVEPTALAILALQACGHGDHPRVAEGVRMLLDRQLANGGWNYGNTTVFGATLLPAPESTGIALCALASHTSPGTVAPSLAYLQDSVVTIRSPLSLAWSLFGLSAWSAAPRQGRQWLLECLERQERYGAFSTDLRAQLVVAWATAGDLRRLLNA
jgi:hypothetical protein